jgi:uncharacterized protein GlcG (DUF336 family)
VKKLNAVRLSAVMLIATLGAALAAQAQTPAPAAPAAPAAPSAPAGRGGRGAPEPPQAMTYEVAMQAMDAAEAEARKNKWNMAIVVTDANGVPVLMRRMTGAASRSYDLAMRKAAVVTATKLTTAEYGEKLKTGAVQEVPNGVTFGGGVPVLRGTEFIGAVAASGARPDQDEAVAKAGAAAVK